MMVSRFGFGGIPIQRVSDEQAVAVVRRCLELGINYLDTANGYANSEERIGKAISGQRDKVILATKTMSRKREGVAEHLELSQTRHAVEHIDLYQFHNVADSNTFKAILTPDGPLAVVEAAKKVGKVKHIGVTSHSMDMAKELVKSGYFETIMFPFNFITHEAAEELLPLTREHDVGFIAMKPFSGGMLGDVDLAFKYLLQFPDVVPIPGIEKVEEIEELVGMIEKPHKLTAADVKKMGRLRQELGNKFCRRCDYCQPCTQEISISYVMYYSTFVKRMPPSSIYSGWVADMMEKACTCVQCGECEERCPYHLPIMEIVEEQAKIYQSGKKRYLEQQAKS